MAEAEIPVKPHLLVISPGEGFSPEPWARVLQSGVDALMIREPQLEARALLALARWCHREAPEVELWVRGRLDVALAAGCGLHAPEAYPDIALSGLRLSRPLHGAEAFLTRSTAAQLLISPVFPVPGKGTPMGPQGLHALLDRLPTYDGRLLALGGIGVEQLPGLRHPRLAGIALIRALWRSPEPTDVVSRLRDAWG